MATVPDTAKARPIYLSSSMKGLVGGERRLWEKAWLVVNTQSATRLDKRIYVSIQHKKGTSCILSYLIYKILNLWSNLSKFIFLFHLTLVAVTFIHSFLFLLNSPYFCKYFRGRQSGLGTCTSTLCVSFAFGPGSPGPFQGQHPIGHYQLWVPSGRKQSIRQRDSQHFAI